MSFHPSRRHFLNAGLMMPAASLSATTTSSSRVPDSAVGAFQQEIKLAYRPLGKTGLRPTAVGFGCMITSDPTVIEKAADLGVNYFDTARGYQNGNNEKMVGAALKSYRKRVLISTKTHADTKAALLEQLETSLRELGTDYVDVWYMHAKSKPEQITDEHVSAIETAKQEGKIRFAGVSTHSGQATLLPGLATNPHIDVILAAYNFTMDPQMTAAVAQARQAGKGVVGMKVMAGGFRRLKPGDALYPKLQKEGAMLAALKWVLNDKNVDTTIPSITDMDQLDENLRAMREPYAAADQALLARQMEYIRPLYCRMCGACDGRCPEGLPVSDILRHLSYAEGYGQFRLGRESFLELPESLRDVRCADCAECAIQCPNGVHIASRLARAQELFA
ncbi:MAG: aldo/keto reductase [Bryobacteraceae bacterium]|nr:aldo/keto reductase [Bryobacteraceae bacterium]